MLVIETDPDCVPFSHFKYPPFDFVLNDRTSHPWGDLRIDGLINGKIVISKTYSGHGANKKSLLIPDDTTLIVNGSDCVRVVLRVEDGHGNIRPHAADTIFFDTENPVEIIGDNPFGLIGRTGAIWIKAGSKAGHCRLKRQTSPPGHEQSYLYPDSGRVGDR